MRNRHSSPYHKHGAPQLHCSACHLLKKTFHFSTTISKVTLAILCNWRTEKPAQLWLLCTHLVLVPHSQLSSAAPASTADPQGWGHPCPEGSCRPGALRPHTPSTCGGLLLPEVVLALIRATVQHTEPGTAIAVSSNRKQKKASKLNNIHGVCFSLALKKKKKRNEERKKKKYFYPSMVDASDFTRPKQPLHALLLPQHPHTATPTPRTRPLPSQTARSPENKAWETLWPQRLVMTALFSGDKSCKGANCRHVF